MQDWTVLTGDVAKFGLGALSTTYCMILAAQHYWFLGRDRAEGRAKAIARRHADADAAAPLLADRSGSLQEDQLSLSAVV